MEQSMYIDDDADIATVVEKTVAAIKEGARLIGKIRADPIDAAQIERVEDAIAELQKILNVRKRMLNA
jgi:hypothetical protein